MADLIARPIERFSALDYHRHRLVSVFNFMGNVIEPSPIEAHDEDVVTVGGSSG